MNQLTDKSQEGDLTADEHVEAESYRRVGQRTCAVCSGGRSGR